MFEPQTSYPGSCQHSDDEYHQTTSYCDHIQQDILPSGPQVKLPISRKSPFDGKSPSSALATAGPYTPKVCGACKFRGAPIAFTPVGHNALTYFSRNHHLAPKHLPAQTITRGDTSEWTEQRLSQIRHWTASKTQRQRADFANE